MLHRTLIPSSSPPPPPSLSLYFKSASYSFPLGRLQPPSLVRPLVYSSCTQVEREAKMEEALKSSLRPESSLSSAHQHQQQQQQNKGTLNDEGSWAAEGGNLSGEGFSVDDLLNLGDYAENDKEAEEAEVVEEVEAKAEAAQAEHKERGDSNSSSPPSSYTSVLFFQPPPPPPPPPLLSDIIPPTHVAEELEWVSFIIDDSLSEIPHCPTVAHFPLAPHHKEADTSAAATAQPGASSLSPAVCGRSTEPMVPAKAKRSKRSRSAAPFAAWCMSGRLPFADSASSTTNSTTSCSASSSCSSSSNTSTSCLIYDHHPAACADQSFLLYGDQPPPAAARKHGPKKRDRKPKPSAASAGSGEWRCSHCGVQKTPQWRAGPLGAKTLCNACGVRFKSGRLLPEYRPACSPTFVSHIHSNSHRKVLEMRRKKESELPLSASAQPVASF